MSDDEPRWTPDPARRLAVMFGRIRYDNRVSLRVVADLAGVNVSVASRAERGGDALVSTWRRLFGGLGYLIEFRVVESDVEAPSYATHVADERVARRLSGEF